MRLVWNRPICLSDLFGHKKREANKRNKREIKIITPDCFIERTGDARGRKQRQRKKQTIPTSSLDGKRGTGRCTSTEKSA